MDEGQMTTDWRCPDCGSGVTKVHATVNGMIGCGKPPGYWTRWQPSSAEVEAAAEAMEDIAALAYREAEWEHDAGRAEVEPVFDYQAMARAALVAARTAS